MVNKSNWPLFNESMQYSLNYKSSYKDYKEWELLEQNYTLYKNKASGEQKIPKILHQIWLGREMPDFEKRLCNQVRQSLPSDWQYILWTEKTINNLKNFKNIDLFNATPSFGQKSDILRYSILHEYGGVYMDTDFLLLQDFNELLDLDFFCGVSYDKEPTMFNGLMGTSAGNKIITDLLTLDVPLQYTDAMSLMNSTGPYFLSRKVFNNIKSLDSVVVFPTSFFYPFPNFDVFKTKGSDYKSYITEESICCHMWSSSWM
jgi:mannosyltransferase OCH1-like enzyme